MTLIGSADLAVFKDLRARIRREAESAPSLQEAAQSVATAVYDRFRESLVLFRIYGTRPFDGLPERDRAFVVAAAASQGLVSKLVPKTTVLSLLGTHGREACWCDRYRSAGHLGIPLISEEFVAGIPMVARLVADLGRSLDWFEQTAPPEEASKPFNHFTSIFFVEDAATNVDDLGRKIIPAQDFVREQGVRSVFGVGGQFAASRMTIVLIFFTCESLTRAQAGRFVPLPMQFGDATLDKAGRNLIFA